MHGLLRERQEADPGIIHHHFNLVTAALDRNHHPVSNHGVFQHLLHNFILVLRNSNGVGAADGFKQLDESLVAVLVAKLDEQGYDGGVYLDLQQLLVVVQQFSDSGLRSDIVVCGRLGSMLKVEVYPLRGVELVDVVA